MNAIDFAARLLASPAYRRCSIDLISVCRRMERRTLARFPLQERENAARWIQAARYADVKALETAPDTDAKDRAASAPRGDIEATGRDIVQTVFPQIDKVKHENAPSRLAFDEVYVMSVLNDRAAHAGKPERKEEAKKKDDKTPYLDGPRQRMVGDIANDIIKKVSLKTGNVVRSSNGSKLKPKASLITCAPLFCRGEKEEDGFSRTIALKYLAKRVIFAPKSNAKGYDAAREKATAEPTKLRDRKTSSSQAKLSLYLASDIEDTIQEAFSLYQMATLFKAGRDTWTTGQWERMEALSKSELKTVATLAKHRTGNVAYDTFAACQRAKNLMTRARHKERKRLDVLAMRMQSREDKERGLQARFDNWLDGKSELDTLLNAVVEHGYENQKKLAEVLGLRPDILCRKLGALRARLEAEEARQVARNDAARLEAFRDWEKAVKAKDWALASKLEAVRETPQEDDRATHTLEAFPPVPSMDKKRAYVRA